MPTHDLIVDNAPPSALRPDLNNALQALGSQQAGGSPPPVTYPCQLWADTTAGLWKMRNSGNTSWVTIGRLNTTYLINPADIGAATAADAQLIGTPVAPTPPITDSTTKIATTAFVQNAISAGAQILNDAATASTTIYFSKINYAIKVASSVIAMNASGFATVGFSTNKIFTGTPVILLSNGDAGATDSVPLLVSATFQNFNFKTPGYVNAGFRLNWIALGNVT